jgi:hypothetical protein
MDRDATGRFVMGHSKGGRPLGSRNKLGKAFMADLYAAWSEHGAAVIKKVREEEPAAYLKVVASILPKQLEIRDDTFDGLSDDELAAIVAYIRDALGMPDASGARAGQAAH